MRAFSLPQRCRCFGFAQHDTVCDIMSSHTGRTYWVYILPNRAGMLYVGVTNDLQRRVQEHRQGLGAGFTSRYGLDRLVYFEDSGDVHAAIAREKQLKGWNRAKKAALIESRNPDWRDLAAELPGGDAAFEAGSQRLRKPLAGRDALLAKLRDEPAPGRERDNAG